MTGAFLYDSQGDWQIPTLSSGTATETGGMVTSPAPGRFTFAGMSSGMTDPDDGVWVEWDARTVTGRLIGSYDATSPSPVGAVLVSRVTDATAGNGVIVYAGVIMGSPGDATNRRGGLVVMSYAATHTVGSGSFGPSVNTFLDGTPAGTSVNVQGVGSWLNNVPQVKAFDADGLPITGEQRAIEAAFGLVGQPWKLVLGAYRTGASAGTESVTVDLRHALLALFPDT